MKTFSAVIGTNILLAALLKDGTTRKILFERKTAFFCPESTLAEVGKYAFELAKRIGLTKEQFLQAAKLILNKSLIIQVNKEEYASFAVAAKELCPTGHENDWPFLALSLSKELPLWSNDAALKSQKVVKVLNTKEVIDTTGFVEK